jgi:hypothetical protein
VSRIYTFSALPLNSPASATTAGDCGEADVEWDFIGAMWRATTFRMGSRISRTFALRGVPMMMNKLQRRIQQ